MLLSGPKMKRGVTGVCLTGASGKETVPDCESLSSKPINSCSLLVSGDASCKECQNPQLVTARLAGC